MLNPYINSLGFIANILSNVAFIPQIVKSYRTKQVKDVSIGMFVILSITQLCWIAYAIPLHATNLWISSVTELVLVMPIYVMWVRYRKNPTQDSAGVTAKLITFDS